MTRVLAAGALNVWSAPSVKIEQGYASWEAKSPQLFRTVGFFVNWFGAVEEQIDRNILHILRVYDFEVFELLGERIPTREKCGKLRAAIDRRGSAVGSNLEARLKLFEKSCIPRRNGLAHGLLEQRGTRIFAVSVSRRPGNTHSEKHWPNELAPREWSIDELLRYALWMRDFQNDLKRLGDATYKKRLRKTVELDHPRSRLRPPIRKVASSAATVAGSPST